MHKLVGESANGADDKSFSTGIDNQLGDRNSPTVWNAGLRQFLFCDGRAASLEEQAKGPLTNPKEMGMKSYRDVEAAVEGIEFYRKEIGKIFKVDKIRIDEIVKAIACYERTLMTPNSKFDRFQSGEIGALTQKEKGGWRKFGSIGCIACHGAPTFSNQDYFIRFPQRAIRETEFVLDITRDHGRGDITKSFAERNRWRVPSLRNVAITGPYFHNGAVQTLEEAVRVMGQAQIGVALSDEDVSDLVAFLNTLTGERPIQVAPELPK